MCYFHMLSHPNSKCGFQILKKWANETPYDRPIAILGESLSESASQCQDWWRSCPIQPSRSKPRLWEPSDRKRCGQETSHLCHLDRYYPGRQLLALEKVKCWMLRKSMEALSQVEQCEGLRPAWGCVLDKRW